MRETIAADDITGANNCPEHLRITAMSLIIQPVQKQPGRPPMNLSSETWKQWTPDPDDYVIKKGKDKFAGRLFVAEKDGKRKNFRSLTQCAKFFELSEHAISRRAKSSDPFVLYGFTVWQKKQ